MYGYMLGIVAMPIRNMGILGEAPDRKEGGFAHEAGGEGTDGF